MALRVMSGQGTAFSVIVVSTSVLAVFLLGWRDLHRRPEATRRSLNQRRSVSSSATGPPSSPVP